MGKMNNSGFGKTICSICYEDLNPIIEDLQSISICGHVFHEICLQQWFEYCTNGKKKNCPVCKQTCSEQHVNRLYFQSIGDPNDISLAPKPRDSEEDHWELRYEVKRLEGKVLGLTSTLEQQQKDLEKVNEELFTCKEELKMEVALKHEAVNQQAAIQQLLHRKSKELDRSTLECIRLQDRNMTLAKELAALKLVCDYNMEEEEVLRLASLGGEANRKETIDVLKKSLVIRNKNYEELMTKCNTLGRREARSLSKYQKAKEKIKKLKARVQELEMALEGKDNEPKADRCSYENQNKVPAETEVDLCIVTGSCDDSRPRRKRKKDKSIQNMAEDIIATSVHKNNHEKDSSIAIKDGGASETSTYVHEVSNQNLHQSFDHKKVVYDSFISRPKAAFGATGGSQVQGSEEKDKISGLRSCSKNSTVNTTPVIILDDDTDLLPLDDITQHHPSSNIRKETSAPVILAQPGDLCFSGGVIGPDGTKWHLGKWCKKVKDKGSRSLSGGLQG